MSNSNSIIKSIIMEIRPRLQSVNVFIIFNIDVDNIKINLKIDNFEIIVDSYDKEIINSEIFHIVPNSLSAVIVKDSFLSFRFSTENIQQNLGTSKFEILENNNRGDDLYDSHNFIINKDETYEISCANCKQQFCSQISFERILPLPDNLDSSDWFCHGHSSSSEIENVIPKLNEIFYTCSYFHVNEDLLKGLINKDLNLVCKRCLAWIGVVLRTMHKVWFNTIIFSNINNNVKFTSCALNDTFITIKQILNSCLFGSIKIVLSCQSFPNKKEYILLWVLEKSLKVRFDTNVVDVAKVLFKFNNDKNCWSNDMNISVVDISKPMMIKLLKHLYEMNRYIPKDFSISNDFYVSYLMLYKDNYK